MDQYEVIVRYAGSLIDIISIEASSESIAKAHAFRRIQKLCGPKYAKSCKYEINK